MASKKVTVLVFLVGEHPMVVESETAWEACKDVIGQSSLLEVVRLDDGVDIYCDEEGLCKGLVPNRAVPARAPEVPEGWDVIDTTEGGAATPGTEGVHVIHGNFIMTRYDTDKETSLSLTLDDIMKYKKLPCIKQEDFDDQ